MIPNIYRTDRHPEPVGRQALHELAAAWAEEQFARKGGLDKMMWLSAIGSRVLWCEIDWEDHRDAYLATMRKMMRVLGAHAYSIVSEAWSASSVGLGPEETKAMMEFADEFGVRALPKQMREDILFVSTFDRDGGASVFRYLVTERRTGLNFLGPRTDEDPFGQGALADNLLIEKGAKQQ